jgi:TolA-binding protein
MMKALRWGWLAGLLLTAPAIAQTSPSNKTTAKTTKTGKTTAATGKTATKTTPVVRPVVRRPSFTKLTPKQRAAEFKLLKARSALFRQAARDYLGEVREMVKKSFRERASFVKRSYDVRINKLRLKAKAARRSAIEYFLAFIRKHPSHKRYTPDAMYRLAELYYEQEKLNFLDRMAQYNRDERRFENKEISAPPVQPSIRTKFATTIQWLNKLVQRFPKYRYLDGAYYILGFCYGEQAQDKESLTYYKRIVNEFPKSRLVAEAWLRLGENYFQNSQRTLAKAAYQKMLAFPKHKMYDKALYKLGWTHFLLDEFEPAVKNFLRVLELYANRKKDGGLRNESIRYIAISLADNRFGSPDKARDFVRKVGLKKPYARDILVELARVYEKQENWKKALKTHLHTRSLFPYHPDTPLVQQKIILMYLRLSVAADDPALKRQYSIASQLEKKKTADMFSIRSVWYRKNKDNPDAMNLVKKILKQDLYRTGVFQHVICQKLVELKKSASQVRSGCISAARYLKQFLKRFPRSKYAYEMTFRLADSLYFAESYRRAMVNFKEVRDWPGEKEFFVPATTSLLDSLTKIVDQACKSGQIRRGCDLPKKKKADEPKKKKKEDSSATLRRRVIKPKKMHKLHKELLEARLFFLKKVGKVKDDPLRIPRERYDTGRLYYAYDDLDQARSEFNNFIKSYPIVKFCGKLPLTSVKAMKEWKKTCETKPVGKLLYLSANSIVASYRREGRLDDMQTAMGNLARQGFYLPYKGELELGILFLKAKRLQVQGKWEEAARAYIKAVDKKPSHKEAAAGLWNAALMFRRANMYGSALKMYERIVKKYGPGSRLLPAKDRAQGWKLADQALFLLASNAERYFQFERAIREYDKLVRDYPRSKSRADALYNAAIIMNNLQQYDRAAKAYRRYATLFPKRKDAADMYWRSVQAIRRLKDKSRTIQAYRDFIRRYRYNNEQTQRILICYGRIMELEEKMGRSPKYMKKVYEKMLDHHNRLAPRIISQKKEVPVEFAAEATYKLAMYKFEILKTYRITSTRQKKQADEIKKLVLAPDSTYKKITAELDKTFAFKSAPWTLCALYRRAHGMELVAEIVRKTPVPKDLLKGRKLTVEIKEVYQEQLDEKFIQPLERNAKKLYLIAVKKARDLNVDNKCTAASFINLNRLDASAVIPKKMKYQRLMNAYSPFPTIKARTTKKSTQLKTPAARPAPRTR